MNRKLYLGLGVLIAVIICATFVFLTIRNQAEIRQMEADLEVAKKKVEKIDTKKHGQPITEAAKQPAFDTNENGHFHEDGTWHEGAHNTSVKENIADTNGNYTLPEDVFSEAYTEKLKTLVQICVDLHHLPEEILSERGYVKAWGGIYDARNDAQLILNSFFSTSDEMYLERYRELMKIIEPYTALFPRPQNTLPESVQRAKAMHPEMADRIDEIWR